MWNDSGGELGTGIAGRQPRVSPTLRTVNSRRVHPASADWTVKDAHSSSPPSDRSVQRPVPSPLRRASVHLGAPAHQVDALVGRLPRPASSRVRHRDHRGSRDPCGRAERHRPAAPRSAGRARGPRRERCDEDDPLDARWSAGARTPGRTRAAPASRHRNEDTPAAPRSLPSPDLSPSNVPHITCARTGPSLSRRSGASG